MKALDLAVQSIATRVADPVERQRYTGLLAGMADDCKAALDQWQQVLTQAAPPSGDALVLMNWTGPVVAKKLFDIHLAFRSKMLQVTDQRGDLEDPVIPSAYHKLMPDQTGTDYAQTAIERARQAMLAMQEHVETIRSTVPKKIAAPSVAAKKNSKKVAPKTAVAKKALAKPKAAAKKVAAKPVVKKKPAAKKLLAKKAVAKSAVKKPAMAKKPVLKNAAPKKAIKQKAKKK